MLKKSPLLLSFALLFVGIANAMEQFSKEKIFDQAHIEINNSNSKRLDNALKHATKDDKNEFIKMQEAAIAKKNDWWKKEKHSYCFVNGFGVLFGLTSIFGLIGSMPLAIFDRDPKATCTTIIFAQGLAVSVFSFRQKWNWKKADKCVHVIQRRMADEKVGLKDLIISDKKK